MEVPQNRKMQQVTEFEMPIDIWTSAFEPQLRRYMISFLALLAYVLGLAKLNYALIV
jgi:hypothetical protein